MIGVTFEAAFEESIEQHLLAHDWVQLEPSAFDRKTGLFADELIAFLAVSQPKEWQRLVNAHGGEQAARVKVVKRVADELTSRGTVDVLRAGVKDSGVAFRVVCFAPATGLTPGLWEQYAANCCGVVRQLHHSESNPADSLDVTLVVNGIPVASAELKNPLTHQNVEDAIDQYRTDRNPADLFFKHRTLVHFAVDPLQVYMTTRLAKEHTVFLPFNQGSAGAGFPGGAGNPENPDGYQTAYLWEQVWQRDNWLNLLGSFIHAEDVLDDNGVKTGGHRILFPRFHQWDAVTKLLAAARVDGPGTDWLVQHSAGSGKSNTIAWTAHQLSRLHTPHDPAALSPALTAAGLVSDEPLFHKVIVITDRVVLDRQLQATVAGFDHTPGTIVTINENSQQLREALEGNAARIIITTLQKFPVVAKASTEVAGKRVAIIVDEAHSSTTGEAIKDMKHVLGSGDAALTEFEQAESLLEGAVKDAEDLLAESMLARGKHHNLSFFAFTATPKAKTLELFGHKVTGADGVERVLPFHTYSMKQAIDEGFIMDVLANYTTYATYYKLANSQQAEDPSVPVGKASAALARFVSLHPTNLAQKAEIIVEHFRQKSAAKIRGHAKAMVVTRSRLHAVRYKQAIDAYITLKGYDRGEHALKALVAFSGSLTDPDVPEVTFTEAFMNGFGEAQLPKQFATDEYQVLVVAEKYQTGFDQPLLHTMYVDKKLAGVKAVQTLSRLNRIRPDKTDTFVLDFANTAEEIQEAFKPFFEQSVAAPTDPNLLYDLQRTLMGSHVIHPDEMAKAVEALLSGETSKQKVIYANLTPALHRFTDDIDSATRTQFADALKSYVRSYVFLAQVMSWHDRELEELYLYGKALQPMLPRPTGDPLPQISDAVLLTHLRTEAKAIEERLSLDEGDDTQQVALPGGGTGKEFEQPKDLLSVIIGHLNEQFGMNITEADRIWFEQQKQAIKESEDVRVVALNNDFDQFNIVLEKFATDAIIDRHQSNGMLFNAFFEKPGFKEALLKYLGTAYHEIREGAAE